MFVCAERQLETWSPDFSSSGQASPVWTRMKCAGVELCNSLEWAEWGDNPVQVRLCDACGHAGCADGGYVHVSRLGALSLWTAPQIEEERCGPAHALERLGAIAFPEPPPNEWQRFPPANNRALADAWVLGPGRPLDVRQLMPMLRAKLIGGDTLEKGELLEIVERLLEELLAHPEAPAAVRIAGTAGARIETLYFDGPAEEDWPALAFIGGTAHLALNRELMGIR